MWLAGQDVFRFAYHDVNLYPFDDNILESVEQSSMATSADDAVALCQDVLCEIAPDAKYCVDNLLAYGSGGRHQFYKIVFKKMVDNTVITAFNDSAYEELLQEMFPYVRKYKNRVELVSA